MKKQSSSFFDGMEYIIVETEEDEPKVLVEISDQGSEICKINQEGLRVRFKFRRDSD